MIAKPQLWYPGINRQSSLSRGVVGNYSFWEGNGSRLGDTSNQSNHGTLTNMDSATAWVGSPYGWALNFGIRGSTDYIQVPTPALPGDLSIIFLIRPGSTTDNCYISDFSGVNEFACIYGFQDGYYNIYGGAYPIGGNAANSQIPMTGVGQWDHVAWTKRGSTLKGYINGREEISGAITAGDTIPSANLQIGRSYGSSTNSVNGLLAYYLLYNRALIPNEVQQHYADHFILLRPQKRTYLMSIAAPSFVPYPYPTHELSGGFAA